MPIDTSIYNALMKPRSVADYAAEYDQQDIRKQMMQRNALMLEQGQREKALYDRGVQDDMTIRNALAGLPADAAPEMRINALRGTGIPAGYAQADAYGKTLAEQQKAKTEAASKNAALIKQYSGVLMQSPNRQTWESLLALYQRQTGDDTQEMRAIFEQAGDDPAMLRQIAAGLSMEADKLLPKTGTVNAGNAQVTQAISPITGVPTETGRVPIMQSPDSAATAGTAAARLAFDQKKFEDEVTQRDAPPKPVPEKPLPAGALKMQQESLDAIGISSSINADLGAVEKQITDGKLKFGPVSNLANAGLNMAGMSTAESRNFASFKSTLERLRNESLRLNTGVQTDGDAQRAWNELFQNINDTGLVKQRLAEIRNINKRGAELHKLRIDSVRGNYGAGPLDSSAYAAQPPALGGAPAAPAGGTVLRFDAQGNQIK